MHRNLNLQKGTPWKLSAAKRKKKWMRPGMETKGVWALWTVTQIGERNIKGKRYPEKADRAAVVTRTKWLSSLHVRWFVRAHPSRRCSVSSHASWEVMCLLRVEAGRRPRPLAIFRHALSRRPKHSSRLSCICWQTDMFGWLIERLVVIV